MSNVEECKGENLLASSLESTFFIFRLHLVRDIRRVIDELDSQLSRMAQSRDEALKALGNRIKYHDSMPNRTRRSISANLDAAFDSKNADGRAVSA